MGLKVTTAPTVEPVSLDEAKTHLRVDGTAEDTYIEALIQAARAWVENYTARQLVQATYEWTFDRFPDRPEKPVRFPRSPVATVDQVEYADHGGTTQTYSSYQLDLNVAPAIMLPVVDGTWPGVQADNPTGVTVTFTAGYEPDDTQSPTDPAGNVPQSLKHAILLLVGHWYERRASVNIGNIVTPVDQTVHFLCAPYRVVSF